MISYFCGKILICSSVFHIQGVWFWTAEHIKTFLKIPYIVFIIIIPKVFLAATTVRGEDLGFLRTANNLLFFFIFLEKSAAIDSVQLLICDVIAFIIPINMFTISIQFNTVYFEVKTLFGSSSRKKITVKRTKQVKIETS